LHCYGKIRAISRGASERMCLGLIDTLLTVPRSFLFFHGRSCSQPCEGANLSRWANTRLRVRCALRANLRAKSSRDLVTSPIFGSLFYGGGGTDCGEGVMVLSKQPAPLPDREHARRNLRHP